MTDHTTDAPPLTFTHIASSFSAANSPAALNYFWTLP